MSGGRIGRRLLVSAAAAVMPFVAIPTAWAQAPINVEITSPGEGASVSGTFTPEVAGKVYTGIGVDVDVIRVVIARHSDGAVVFDENVCCDRGRNGTIPFSATAPSLSRNGPYTARVAATGHFLLNGLAVSPQSADRTFAMAVPPAPPNLATPQVIDHVVKLAWTPGRADPDLMGYALYRKVGSGAFQGLAGLGPTVTTFTDDQLPPDFGGAIQYRVDALRQGAVISHKPQDWLARPSSVVTATLTAPPATGPPSTQPGETTTSTTPGGGLQPNGAVNTTDLGALFGGGGSVPTFPTPTIPAIPDPGFSELLPFPSTSGASTIGGRQRALADDDFGETGLDADLDDSNRRALLVPVAGGSILCVAALHLRWFNRRLATGAIGAAAGKAGVGGKGLADLEPAEPHPDAFSADREPVGAGSAAGRSRG